MSELSTADEVGCLRLRVPLDRGRRRLLGLVARKAKERMAGDDAEGAWMRAEAKWVRVVIAARMEAAVDPARKVRLYNLGQAIELLSGLEDAIERMIERADDTRMLLPDMPAKVASFRAARARVLPALLRAADADLPDDAPEFDEIVRLSLEFKAVAADMTARLVAYAERIGVPLQGESAEDEDEVVPPARPN